MINDKKLMNNEKVFQNSMRAGDNNLRVYFVWPNIIIFRCKLDYDYVVDNLRGQLCA